MTVALLDSSALLAHALGEEGAATVGGILASGQALVAAPTVAEFSIRLQTSGVPADRVADAWRRYRALIDVVVPIDEGVAGLALELRAAATARVPLTDLLIAAAAASRGAVLVHRDPHLDALPDGRPLRRSLLG